MYGEGFKVGRFPKKCQLIVERRKVKVKRNKSKPKTKRGKIVKRKEKKPEKINKTTFFPFKKS